MKHNLQLELPHIQSVSEFIKMNPITIHSFLSVAEGMKLIRKLKSSNTIHWNGINVARLAVRHKLILDDQCSCVTCENKLTHFVLQRPTEPHLDTHLYYTLTPYSNKDELTWDHIVPKVLAGSDDFSNAQMMCLKCNALKRDVLTMHEMIEFSTDPIHAKKFKHQEHGRNIIIAKIKKINKELKAKELLTQIQEAKKSKSKLRKAKFHKKVAKLATEQSAPMILDIKPKTVKVSILQKIKLRMHEINSIFRVSHDH